MIKKEGSIIQDYVFSTSVSEIGPNTSFESQVNSSIQEQSKAFRLPKMMNSGPKRLTIFSHLNSNPLQDMN